MSAVQGSVKLDEFFVLERRESNGSRAFPYSVFRWDLDGQPTLVDLFRTRSGAHHAARLLNRGVAMIEPHALFSCRVVAK
jgi:hypothetical protein